MPSSTKNTSTKVKAVKAATKQKKVKSVAPKETVASTETTVASTETAVASTESAVASAVDASHQVTESVDDVSVEQQFKDIFARIQEFRTLATSLTADVRKLQKNVAKHVRESNKKNRKRAPRLDGTKRPPSGFAKPALISDSLCQFLGKPSGTEMARTEVTKYLTQYIKQHSLQDSENKRRINCDSALKSLLKVEDSDEVTYFNLQRYMKPHFPISSAAKAAAAAALLAETAAVSS